MLNVYLFQPQFTMDFNSKIQYWIPYSVGCIWSYAAQYDWISNNFELKDLIFSREKISKLIDRLDNPAVCGFSCYLWNEKYCLAAAQAIKSRWPNCLIIFGGPQINTDTLSNTFIDCIIMGEGEKAFVDICKTLIDGRAVEPMYLGQRMEYLEIPSPYTTGVFDKIIKQNPTAVWQMTMETNRGCPYSCTFCDWGSLTYSKVKQFTLEKVTAEIEWAANNPVTYFYCADANFGIFKERDTAIAKIMRDKLYNTQVETISIQFAKNSNETVIDIAKIIGPLNKGLTLSVQSLNDKTLTTIKRKNLASNNIKEVLAISAQSDIKTYSELILGMPDETLESWRNGITELLEIGQHQSIEVWFCQLLKNSELASQDSRKTHKLGTILVKDYMAMYNDCDEEITEYVELVNQTATMSTQELIDCYMYAWMIIHFHISGYTELTAKSARATGISYRKFYDALYDKIPLDSVVAEHYQQLKNYVSEYLTSGKTFYKNGHAIHSYSYNFMYDNKQQLFELGNQTYLDLVDSATSELLILQKSFIYDHTVDYPHIISINLDSQSLLPSDTVHSYKIDSQFDSSKDLYAARRKGLLKNSITQLGDINIFTNATIHE